MCKATILRPFLRLFAAALVALCVAACQPGPQEESTTFQEAEALYRVGDYDSATTLYTDFLASYPRSPFAKTARLRLRTIEREMGSVMTTRGGNKPIYIRPAPAEGPRQAITDTPPSPPPSPLAAPPPVEP